MLAITNDCNDPGIPSQAALFVQSATRQPATEAYQKLMFFCLPSTASCIQLGKILSYYGLS